ncbi:hypothetical protein BVX97_04960 [bacterium E08(2017)]|nr:hypothetical protein BVX97_04960 [bacterium E08(2017)]
MKMFINAYIKACQSLNKSGRSWRRHVTDLLLAIGAPLSTFAFAAGFLAYFGIIESSFNGEVVTGGTALLHAFLGAVLHVPMTCIFVGSMDYVVTEFWKKKN